VRVLKSKEFLKAILADRKTEREFQKVLKVRMLLLVLLLLLLLILLLMLLLIPSLVTS